MFLSEAPEARALHVMGLEAAKTGDFEAAYEALNSAMGVTLASEKIITILIV